MSDHDRMLGLLRDLLHQHALEVDRAIAAHAQWRSRLAEAVTSGRCEGDPAEIERDDQCELGRWLHDLPAESRADEGCLSVFEMHSWFHREAGRVVKLVQEKRLDEARAAIAPDSLFDVSSRQLVELLERWREAA